MGCEQGVLGKWLSEESTSLLRLIYFFTVAWEESVRSLTSQAFRLIACVWFFSCSIKLSLFFHTVSGFPQSSVLVKPNQNGVCGTTLVSRLDFFVLLLSSSLELELLIPKKSLASFSLLCLCSSRTVLTADSVLDSCSFSLFTLVSVELLVSLGLYERFGQHFWKSLTSGHSSELESEYAINAFMILERKHG